MNGIGKVCKERGIGTLGRVGLWLSQSRLQERTISRGSMLANAVIPWRPALLSRQLHAVVCPSVSIGLSSQAPDRLLRRVASLFRASTDVATLDRSLRSGDCSSCCGESSVPAVS
jgi:hypothetical protein